MMQRIFILIERFSVPPQSISWKRLLHERWLYILLLIALLGATAAYQQPQTFRLNLTSRAGAALIEGFQASENGPSGPFRWTTGRASVYVPNGWPWQAVDLALTLSAPRPAGQAAPDGTVPIQVFVNNRLLATVPGGSGPAETVLHVPADLTGPDGDVYVTLVVPTFAPPNDLRQLGAILGGLTVRPAEGQQAPFAPPPQTVLSVALVAGLIYLWLRRLGVRVGPALAAGLVATLAACAGLWAARPFVTAVSNRLLLLLIVAGASSELFMRLGGLDAAPSAMRTRRRAAGLFLLAFGVRLALAHTPGDHDNFLAFKMMIDNLTRHGIAAAYGIDPIIGAYPPVHHYLLDLVGNLYRAFVSPEFDVASRRLNFVMKLPTITLDMLITLTVMVYAARRRGARDGTAAGARLALLAGAAYALNPGIIYTTAYNGQLGDPLYALFVTLAVAALLMGWAGATGAATALAVLTKPQASAFLPFLALASLRHLPCRDWPRALAGGGIAGLIVLAPFIAAGTVGQMIHTVSTTIGHGPRIVSEAHNIWWLVGWGNAWHILDTQLMSGLVPYRAVGLVLFFGAAYGAVLWRVWTAQRREAGRPETGRPETLSLLAAFVGLAFFMLPTEIHENYLFPTFPLLALAAVHDRRAWGLGAVLTLSWTLNLLIIDQTLMKPLLAAWPGFASAVFPLRVAGSVVNVGVLLAWAWWLFAPGARLPNAGQPEAVSRTKITVQ
jgi:hypothetical protein